LHRRTDLALLKRKGRIGNRAVDDGGLGHHAEVNVLLAFAKLLGDVEEARALGDALCRRACRLGIGKVDLQDVPPLGGYVARAALLIGALEIGVGDLDPSRLLAREQRHDH
jgi:hypothetical protein